MKRMYPLISVLILSGCTSTMWVSEKADDDSIWSYKSVEGIPFYTKKEVFDHTTTYSQSWLKVSLVVDKKLIDMSGDTPKTIAKNSQSFTKNVEMSKYPTFDAIKKDVATTNEINSSKVKAIINSFLAVDSITDFDSIKPIIVSNTITSLWVVDEDSEYYLNAPLPWFGSSNLTQEINSDGTLSKATSNPDTKLAEGISSLIPFKEYLSAKHVAPLLKADEKDTSKVTKELAAMNFIDSTKPKPADNSKLKILYEISLKADQTGYLYSFTNRTKDKPDANIIAFDNKNGVFSRKPISNSNKKDKKEKDSSPKIGFSGSVTLPKTK